MKRVALVLAAALVASLAFAQFGGAHWTLKKQTDPFTDKNTSYAYLMSEDASAFNKSAIVLRCNGKDAYEIFVVFDRYLNDGPVNVMWRFGSKSPESGSWDVSTDGTAVFVPERLLQDFRHALTIYSLAVQATGYDGQKYVLKFDTGAGGNFASLLGQLPCVLYH